MSSSVYRRNKFDIDGFMDDNSSKSNTMLLNNQNIYSDDLLIKENKKWSSAYEISRQKSRTEDDLIVQPSRRPNYRIIVGSVLLLIIGMV